MGRVIERRCFPAWFQKRWRVGCIRSYELALTCFWPLQRGNLSSDKKKHAILDQNVKLEDNGKGCDLKRKKEQSEGSAETRTTKFKRSSTPMENKTQQYDLNGDGGDEDEKRKAGLMRNRESAQLSRQRKKHYMEELEEKLRSMHSTIADLSRTISFVMAKNTTLRQQLGVGGMCSPPPAPGMCPLPN